MAALQQARVRYQNRLPDDCFKARVPDWLQPFQDDVIVPSQVLLADDGFKWLKFTTYNLFCDAIRDFWLHYGPGIQHLPVHVLVMGYASLNDAHLLHQLVLQPDLLPNTFAQAIEIPLEGDVQGVQFAEEDDGELDIWEEREGALVLEDHGVAVHLFVRNYELLWVKAEKFCVYTFMSDPMEGLLAQLALCDQHLHQPAVVLQGAFQENLLQAISHLLFAMYLLNVNPHDVIFSLFPIMHKEVYQACVNCGPNVEEAYKLDPPDTMLRLYDALVDIGLHQYVENLALDEAYENLMSA